MLWGPECPLQLLFIRCPSSSDERLVKINKRTVIFTWPTQLANLWRPLKSYSNQRDPNTPAEPICKRSVDLHKKQTHGARSHVKIQKGEGLVRHHRPVCFWNGRKSGTQLQRQTSSMTTATQLACVFAVKSFTNTFTLGVVSCPFAGEVYHSCPYMLPRWTRASDCVLQFLVQQAANCGCRLKCAKNSIQCLWCRCTMYEIKFFSGGALIRKESVLTGTRQSVKQKNKKKIYFLRNEKYDRMR